MTTFERITSEKAREMLEKATPWPWKAFSQMRHIGSPSYIVDANDNAVAGEMLGSGVEHGNSEIITKAPELAATLAWLYGREHNVEKGDSYVWNLGGGWGVATLDDLIYIGNADQQIVCDTLEEAEDMARYLLNASEKIKARNTEG